MVQVYAQDSSPFKLKISRYITSHAASPHIHKVKKKQPKIKKKKEKEDKSKSHCFILWFIHSSHHNHH